MGRTYARQRHHGTPVRTIDANEPATAAWEAMRLHRIRHDARDHVKGIVTVVDVLELLGRGVERPTIPATRAILKNRGVVPRRATAKSGAKPLVDSASRSGSAERNSASPPRRSVQHSLSAV